MKNEKLEMINEKKMWGAVMNYAGRILVCLGLAALLAGCFNLVNPPLEGTSSTGTGRVILSVSESGSRTILPGVPVFVKYEFAFEALDGQGGHDKVTVTPDGSYVRVELAQGRWNIIAKGYVRISGIDGIANGDYRAAEGKVENLMLHTGAIETISINLRSSVQVGEKGILNWDINFPDNADSATMTIRTIGGELIAELDVKAQPQGKMALEAGYYLLTLKLDDERPKTEVLHIYSGLISSVERLLSRVPTFNKLSDLEYYLGTVPANTADTPYDIILYGQIIEDSYYNLGGLYGALNGKYVNLDMDACQVRTISRNDSVSNTDKIVSIILPEGLTSIGYAAFLGCSGLTGTLTIPNGVTSIGSYAFTGCSGLTGSLTIPDGVTSIGNLAFSNCSGLTGSLTIPDGVTSIGYQAFCNCTGLTGALSIGNGVTSIGNLAFTLCSGLTVINVDPANAAYSSQDGVLYNKEKTTLITCPGGKTGSFTIPNNVTSIGDHAFAYCSGLIGALTIPDGVTSIGDEAFYFCSGLTGSLTIPDGVTSIGSDAFVWCSGLTSVTIGNGVTSIGYSAFLYCNGFTSVTIGNGVTSIEERAFSSCSMLTEINIDPANDTYCSQDGVLYNKAKTALIAYPGGKTYSNYIIPDGVTSIGEYAFSGCRLTGSLTIPDGVTSIGDSAFLYCSELTSVTIGNGVTSIGENVFSWCSGLTSVTIPDGITSIGLGAFFQCSGLTSVTIPASVTSIGGYAFNSCYWLISVTIPASVTSIGSDAFPRDLRDKYYAQDGGAGTYVLVSESWEKS
ncbi:hypothetical protein R84B8_03116 [Treponema sp. R8-4-B8]